MEHIMDYIQSVRDAYNKSPASFCPVAYESHTEEELHSLHQEAVRQFEIQDMKSWSQSFHLPRSVNLNGEPNGRAAPPNFLASSPRVVLDKQRFFQIQQPQATSGAMNGANHNSGHDLPLFHLDELVASPHASPNVKSGSPFYFTIDELLDASGGPNGADHDDASHASELQHHDHEHIDAPPYLKRRSRTMTTLTVAQAKAKAAESRFAQESLDSREREEKWKHLAKQHKKGEEHWKHRAERAEQELEQYKKLTRKDSAL